MVIEQKQTQKKIRLCLCKPLRKSYSLLYCLSYAYVASEDQALFCTNTCTDSKFSC